jgi:23S rRNA (pseudouridine1915-N3)-methyltransferase
LHIENFLLNAKSKVPTFTAMKFLMASVGKPHDVIVAEGIKTFTQRMQHYFPTDWWIITPPKNANHLPEGELKKAEANAILAGLQPDDYLLLLDERGKQLSSIAFAKHIEQLGIQGIKRVVILIGGAFGVHDTIFKRANYTLSLSSMVLPHMLVRLVIAEQLYRACTILRNEKYHHQ